MELSVIIPIYNESKIIKNSVNATYDFLFNNKKISSFELICIDDGSMDSTREIIKELSKIRKEIKLNPKRANKGKGYSVKEGIKMSSKERVLFFDADLSTPLKEIDNFLNILETDNIDILIGSRNNKNSNIKRSFKRTVISRTFSILKKIICGIYYQDTQCGFKMFKNNAAKDIFDKITINGFTFDVEMLVIAKNKNYSVKEVPIEWNESKETSFNIVKQIFKMLKDLFYIRKRNKKGMYG